MTSSFVSLAMRPGVLFLCVTCAWAGNALYAIAVPGGWLKYWSPGLVGGATIAFTLIHGARCYGRDGLLRFVLIVSTFGWLFETIGIAAGSPFGLYYYTDLMVPFVGRVPLSVMPAYCVMGYICWSLARLIWSGSDSANRRADTLRVPLTGALLMVIWDVSMDPLRATVEGRWIWIDGGSYFGIPVTNFFGWFVVTWVMFQTFAFLVERSPPVPGRQGRRVNGPQANRFWLSAALMYLAFPVEYLLNGLVSSGHFTTLGAGPASFTAADVYTGVAVITGLTMLPIGMACAHRAVITPPSALPAAAGAPINRSEALTT